MRDELERCYRQHRQGLFSMALTITGSPQVAEDAVQDAFARMCRLEGARVDELRCYVFAAVRNAAIDASRRDAHQRKTMESVFNGFVPPTAASAEPHEDVLTAERDAILRRAIETLPPDVREVILLKAFAGLTFEEVSRIVDAPMKTVASRYRRALGKLESVLRDQL